MRSVNMSRESRTVRHDVMRIDKCVRIGRRMQRERSACESPSIFSSEEPSRTRALRGRGRRERRRYRGPSGRSDPSDPPAGASSSRYQKLFQLARAELLLCESSH